MRTRASLVSILATTMLVACAGESGLGPGSGGSVQFVGAGDIASCTSSGDEATAALLDGISGVVFTLGDNVYPDGTPAEFASCYAPTWGRHRARTRPAPGNHDYTTAGAPGYFGYFGSAAGSPGTGYYSYDLGRWHAIVLNSNISVSTSSAQLAWLRNDLAGSSARCTLAYWHHPRFSSGTEHGSDPTMGAIWDALYKAGVDLVLNGHEHNYERFAPQTPTAAADPAFGVREIIVGTGGMDESGPFGTPIANSQVRNTGTPGVLLLTLDSTSYRWRFVPVAGRTFSDSGSTPCHDSPATASMQLASTAALITPHLP